MNAKTTPQRDRIIVRTSLIGIIANVLLAAFKAAVGALSGSIAIVLDAVNNLSDALSSVITIIGTKIAGKAPDKKHPFGHGRVEYLSAAIIAVIVLYAGFTSLMESIKKILHPQQASYTTVTLLIVAVAVVVKILLGRFVKSTGEKVHSDSLIASGSDAMFDSIISASTLVAALIFLTTQVSLEAYLAAVISLIIIKSGVEMLYGTLSQIVGERVSSELSKDIKSTVCETDGVMGAYDLILNDYGPDRYLGSVHIEVPDTFTADRIDAITRKIQQNVFLKHNVIMATVGIYSVNTKQDKAATMRDQIRHIVMNHDNILQVHGFYVNEETKQVSFDLVIDYQEKDRRRLYEHICEDVQAAFPGYQFVITMDSDISD